jgi:hypothetical protein
MTATLLIRRGKERHTWSGIGTTSGQYDMPLVLLWV